MSTHPVQVSFEERRDNKCSHIAAKDVPGKNKTNKDGGVASQQS